MTYKWVIFYLYRTVPIYINNNYTTSKTDSWFRTTGKIDFIYFIRPYKKYSLLVINKIGLTSLKITTIVSKF